MTIEIDGKKVALGVPGAARPQDSQPDPNAYPLIPLRRGGTPDEAAAAVLLYVFMPHRGIYLTYRSTSLASPLASYVSGHTLEVTGGAGI